MEEVLASFGCGGRRKEHHSVAGSAIATENFSLKLLNGKVDEEARVAGPHFGEDPFFALLVAHCSLPCRKRDTDCLDKRSIERYMNLFKV